MAWEPVLGRMPHDLGILIRRTRFGRSVRAGGPPRESQYTTQPRVWQELKLHLLYAGQKLVAAVRAHTNRVRLVSEYPAVQPLVGTVILALALNEPSSYPRNQVRFGCRLE